MNKIFILLVAGSMAISVSADLTGFSWKGGRIFDETGTQITVGNVDIYTTTVDLTQFAGGNNSFLVSGDISIADIPGSFYSVNSVYFAPPFLDGIYSTATINGSNIIEGKVLPVVYGLVDINGGGIQIGDYLGFTAGFQTIDLDPGGVQAELPQIFETGDIHIYGIPEPTSLSLIVLISGGVFFTRRICAIQ